MASDVSVRVDIDQKKLEDAVNFASGTAALLREDVAKRKAHANALAAGYKTPKWHDHTTGETKGGTQAAYGNGVKRGTKGHVGIVYTANYAAQKENHEHNTLLKVKG